MAFTNVVLLGVLSSVLLGCAVVSSHPTGCGSRVWRKLNQDKVCFGAADGTNGKFTTLVGMNVFSFKYVRRGGMHECEPGFGGYFGCEMYPHAGGASHHYQSHAGPPAYHVHVPYGAYRDEQRDEPANDEPAEAAEDKPANDEPQAHGSMVPAMGAGPAYMHQCSVFLTDAENSVLMPEQPFFGAYYTIPGIQRPSWDTSIELHVYNSPLSVLKDQELRLYHGEDLFNIDAQDNSGELCVDVYGYGEVVYPQ